MEECQPIGVRKVRASTGTHRNTALGVMNDDAWQPRTTPADYYADPDADPDGTETVQAWDCQEGCPVALLDQQSGTLASHGIMRADTPRTSEGGYHGRFPKDRVGARDTYGDKGGASRFFYTAKAPGQERVTIDGVSHPTVKPLELMRWLVRLVTPPGGIVLDMFCGSGTTGEAAMLEGFRAVMIDNDMGSCRSAVIRSDPFVRRRRKLVTTEQGQVVEAGEDMAPRLF